MLVLCALFPDMEAGTFPLEGRPKSLRRSASATRPRVLGDVSGALGLRDLVTDSGHDLIATSDIGPDSTFERSLPRAEVVIAQPSWHPILDAAALTAAEHLKLIITAGTGVDWVDAGSAASRGIVLAEASASDTTSTAEHVVLQLLALTRNFVEAHRTIEYGGWNLSEVTARQHDLRGMDVGVYGSGAVGQAVMRLLAPFGVHLTYHDERRLVTRVESGLDAGFRPSFDEFVRHVDALSINVPLSPATRARFTAGVIATMRDGAYLVNTASADIVDPDAVARALATGKLGGYAGDVWDPEPPPVFHPWRLMVNNAMTPHVGGASLNAQAQYAADTREIVDAYLHGRAVPRRFVITEPY